MSAKSIGKDGLEAAVIVREVKEYFEERDLRFFEITEKSEGDNKYLIVRLCIKLKGGM